ncbi:hypothetical protein MKW92_005737 [Papaver armeniacum]|nr:hypothetical protein MKW92_005737 [Papaver armeniacum]
MRSPMARNLGFLFVLISVVAICEASVFQPVSENHRSAALELFSPVDGSFTSLEEAYEALRTFQILGVEENTVSSTSTCPLVVKNLQSSSSPKDLFYALKVNSFLNCKVEANTFAGIFSKLQAAVKDASSVLDYYYSVGSLVLIKDKGAEGDALLADADGTFHSIKALSHSDGRWRLNSKSAESSIYAAGLALEALAGVVSLSSAEIDQSLIGTVKNDVVKLFDSLEKYDDGASYFNEKLTDAREDQGPISTSSSVVRGLAAFASVSTGKINLSGDKILGLAKYFLGIGVPGSAKDLFNQIDSLYNLENSRVSVPLILSLPATVVSLSDKNQLKVKVTTVLGSGAPPLTVKLVQAFQPSSKDTPLIENKELKFDSESNAHSLDVLPLGFDIGKYVFVFRVLLHDSEHKKIYATGGQTQVPIFFTGSVKVDNAEIAVLDSDLQSTGNKKKLDLSGDTSLSLSADHLQKLQLTFELITTLGHSFKPEQVFLKLTHETKVEHIFVVGSSGSQFEIVLDFLRLVEKFYYLSGRYNIQLTVGDAAMENSFHRDLGHVELDLPKAPEKATRAPLQPADPYLRYGPKPEITHIFRLPEKRPRQELSLAFLVLTFVPLFGFLLGLLRLGVNLKKFPTSESSPLVHAVLFHVFLAAILGWYLLFWLKMDLFTTLKQLGILGAMLLYFGHRTLSYLASGSSKQKSA